MAIHQLIRALRHLCTNGPVLPEYGVLWNVRHLTGNDSAVEIKLLRQYSPQHPIDCTPTDPTGWDSPSRRVMLNWLIHTVELEARQQ